MDSIMASTAIKHPIQKMAEVAGGAGVDPRPLQRSSFFAGANDGPAVHAARITGLMDNVKKADDGPYFTNNEGIPFPDTALSTHIEQ